MNPILIKLIYLHIPNIDFTRIDIHGDELLIGYDLGGIFSSNNGGRVAVESSNGSWGGEALFLCNKSPGPFHKPRHFRLVIFDYEDVSRVKISGIFLPVPNDIGNSPGDILSNADTLDPNFRHLMNFE